MDVPFVDLKRNYERIATDIDDAMSEVIDSTQFVGGDAVDSFERSFARYLGVSEGVGVASGTDAIKLALEALGVDDGDEVVTVSHTFVSSVDGIVHNGARPRFVDIDPDTYTLDTDELDAAVTDRTAAIVPVHLYGQPVDMDPVLELAEHHDVPVLEDACQAHGAQYRGKTVGQLGDIACFSFYPSKNLGAFGDGGFVATDDSELAAEVAALREYGETDPYRHTRVGYNSRLDSVQAAVLGAKLPHLDEWNQQRRHAADLYDRLLEGLPVTTPTVADDAEHIYHLYVVRTDRAEDRDALRDFLNERGVSTGIHYPIPVHEQPCYQELEYEFDNLQKTEYVADRILSLPMFPEITDDEVAYVCEQVAEFFDS